ncbi:glycosyltransferase family 39 protein [Dyadobacter sp. Leaf189]|uniref:ArnT family glycosyltransferase n=1 Tax=Dyadobacter sp. Leaf189 TaxID=1736295 RepID=UPI0009E966B1|nr:glycosyltransferase family 39 protein [Dyadobacter sp. Leaf189]
MMHLATRSAEYIKVLAWIFTISFILITFLPRSMDDTMFMDGVTYASIARNMSIGIGSFWRPFFAHSFWLPYDNHEFFSGHPPLQFGMQAVMFRLIGDSIVVENIYNLLVLASSIFLIIKIWCLLLAGKPLLRKFSWLPVLCWYAMETVWYSIPNNFLDSTLSVFCLLSCYFQLLFFTKRPAILNGYLFAVAAGICIAAGFLTKGPVSLYPLAFPLIYTISFDTRRIKQALFCTVTMLGTLLVGFLLLLSYQPACDFMRTYFEGQVVQALLQKREKTGVGLAGHFYLLTELLRNVYPHLLALIALNAAAWLVGLRVAISRELKQIGVLSLLVTASVTLPMLVSIKQYSHYLVPALPFAALFFATLFVEKTAAFSQLYSKLLLPALLVGCIACWTLTAFKVSRIEQDIMAGNALRIRKFVHRSATIGVCHELFQDANIHANFQRYHCLSLTTDTNTSKYIFADSTCLPQFNAETDSIIPLKNDYLLVIRNMRPATAKPAISRNIKITLPDS